MQPLYHIALKSDWERAQEEGAYNISTLGKTYEMVGFIHLSFANQVSLVADLLYKRNKDLVLLKINPEKLESNYYVEAAEGTNEKFPHLYGLLNIDAVEKVSEYRELPDGGFPVVSS